jgi:hydrogenase small subunit
MIIPDRDLWIHGEETLSEHLERRGVSRRAFMAFCTSMAAVLASAPAAAAAGHPQVTPESLAEGLGSLRKPVLVWLQLQECTGCMESVLRAGGTTVEDVILNLVSMDYNELLMAPAGDAANAVLAAANAEPHVLVVNGSIPLAEDGIYTMIAGRTAEQILRESAANASAIFAVGACAHWGCVQASHPNPTGAVGVDEVITDKKVINVAGCPPIGEVIIASLVYTLSYGSPPPVDDEGRPLFAYGSRIHDMCPRRARFEAGQMVVRFDDGGAREGHCLYQVGCRGPETFAPCPVIQWNMHTDWPIGAGHPCIGCTEPQFYDRFTPFYQVLPQLSAPGISVEASAEKVGLIGLGVVGAGVAAHAVGSAVWGRREARAAERVRLPLLGDLPTHNVPLAEQGAGPGHGNGQGGSHQPPSGNGQGVGPVGEPATSGDAPSGAASQTVDGEETGR